MKFRNRKNRKKGFSLVEMVIFLALFVFTAAGFFRVISLGMRNMNDAKNKIAAAQLANEKLEIIRNMPYEQIGTTSGAPAGVLSNSENVTRSNTKFTVETSITYVDDDFDGLFPADTSNNDYKNIELNIKWPAEGVTKSIQVMTNIAPPGTEELYTGGILSIDVRDSAGNPVQGARVDVSRVGGTYSTINFTQSNGKVYLIGLDAAEKAYKIKVSKDGYYTVETMPPYSVTPYDPVDEHASVVLATIWPQTIEFNRLANINVKTQDPLGNNIANIDFTLEGGRKLGDTVPASLPVYSYAPTNNQTDVGGQLGLNNLSSGKYIFTLRSTTNNNGYEFWKMANPFNGTRNNFFADPGATTEAVALLLSQNSPSLLVTITDAADGVLLSGAQLKLRDSLNNEQTATTDQFGQAYFGSALANGDYHLYVSLSGYQDFDQNVTINALTKSNVQLVKN